MPAATDLGPRQPEITVATPADRGWVVRRVAEPLPSWIMDSRADRAQRQVNRLISRWNSRRLTVAPSAGVSRSE
ncbi:hypothetical protein GCM10027452_38270 [Micromonospora halotolerans]